MKLEFARPGDEAQVKQILAGCELPHDDITSTHLRHFFVARDDNQLVGVIGLEILGGSALLRSLAVPDGYRDQGLGSKLTERAEEYARSQKVKRLYLLTTTAGDFFAARGYQETGRETVPADVQGTVEFRNLCPSSAVCMVKQLGGEYD